MAKKMVQKPVFQILGLALIVGLAGAALFVSSQLISGKSLAPNAPESKPAASDGCDFKATKQKKDDVCCKCASLGKANCTWTDERDVTRTYVTSASTTVCNAKKIIVKCTPKSTKCEGSVMKTCDSKGSSWKSDNCAWGCSNNKCNVKQPESYCEHGAGRCDENVRSVCNQGVWEKREVCTKGCSNGQCVTTKVCVPGTRRCTNRDYVETCNRYGGGWETASDQCSMGCQNGTCNKCIPGERKCSMSGDNVSVVVCNTNGASWSTVRNCAQKCDNASCVSY